MSWALRPVTGVEQLPRFEEGIAAALAGTTASVLCQYDRDRFDAVTLASVAGFHTLSVAAATYHAGPLLRICRQYAPPGIRIAGELDYQAASRWRSRWPRRSASTGTSRSTCPRWRSSTPAAP